MSNAIVWFRQDLRLTDNPALYYAVQEHHNILPLYIFEENYPWSMGKAQQWWLHHSLLALAEQFKQHGLALILKRGNALNILQKLCGTHRFAAIYWNRCYEPVAIKRDTKITQALTAIGVKIQNFNGSLLHDPWEITNQQGRYFKVFTPYWRACQKHLVNAKIFALPALTKTNLRISSDGINNWQLLPSNPNWALGFEKLWIPGEQAGQKKLKSFLQHGLADYSKNRDVPALEATSKLSPYLHFGEISPIQIWRCIKQVEAQNSKMINVCESFLRQLGWREFSYHLLYHFPHFSDENFQQKFNRFAWVKDTRKLIAWQKGATGYPIVDAGMRELWCTGYMHNRVRMIVASFLTKHLLIDWRYGAKWFWNTLVDADLANNSMGWQWVAGSGVDAAPYYRIFNPVLQGKKFDPQGEYVRRWVPELSRLNYRYLHQPWRASEKILSEANIQLGKTYPRPIVDHAAARKKALAYYKKIK